jgi:N-methylhydantoinase B
MASKVVGVKIGQGQRVRLESPGGGGWGDPAQRPKEAIARDIRLGFVSVDSAARDYGYKA